eukprot:1678142-Pyramimonas_sp.AAC.1
MNMCNDTSVMCPPGATIPGVFALLVSTLAICTKATRSWFYSYNSIILFSNTALLCADANVSPDWHKKSPNTDRSIPQSQSRQGGGNMPGQLPANPVNATSLGRRKERDMKYIARRWQLASQAPKSTVGRPMAVCQQGIYVEYSMEYSKCRRLNGILVSTVDDCRLLN